MSADYSIERLASDLKAICARTRDEHEILMLGRPLALRAAAAKDSWLEPRMYEADPEQGFGVHQLYEGPGHMLAIFAVSWLPNRGTPPHDHGTWALVAGVDGPELNRFYERIDDSTRPGHAELRPLGEKVFEVGEVAAMPSGHIHVVWNETERVTLSLHIYGKHPNFTDRSQFDLQARTEMPFRFRQA